MSSAPPTPAELAPRYAVDRGALPPALAARFVALAPDAATLRFLGELEARRMGPWRAAARRALGAFLSDFELNGLLDVYPLFLLGADQWRTLVGPWARGRLLDVGAGAGMVTAELAPAFDEVVAVETARAMHRHLRRRGFTAVGADLTVAPAPAPPYQVVTLLNVLDRCARPRTLLRRLRAAVAPGGVLVISMPLPYQPFYYRGPSTLDPEERLDVPGEGRWEAALTALAERELTPAGLRLLAFTRVPYLSAGDGGRACYVLDAAVLVTEPAP